MCDLVFAQAPVSVLLTQEQGKEIIQGCFILYSADYWACKKDLS